MWKHYSISRGVLRIPGPNLYYKNFEYSSYKWVCVIDQNIPGVSGVFGVIRDLKKLIINQKFIKSDLKLWPPPSLVKNRTALEKPTIGLCTTTN